MLHPDHKADLEKSGLRTETIKAAGVYSARQDLVKGILGWNAPVESLLAFPYPGTKFTRYKLFPPINRDSKEQKYHQLPGSPVHLYVPPDFKSDECMIRITEGEKKALKGTQEGLNVCGLGGIWNFAKKDDNGKPEFIDDLKKIEWSDRSVELIPDGDFQVKPQVCHAVYRLGKMLEEEGANVSIVQLPKDQKLDDYLCQQTVEDFSTLTRIELDHPIFKDSIIKEEGYIEAIRSSVIGSGTFMEQEFELDSYIMRPWLKPGVLAMVYAQPGVGKTFLCLALALAITRKVSIGPWQCEQPAGCLYVDGEMSCKELQSRLRKLSEGLPSNCAPLHILSAENMRRVGWPTPNLLDAKWRDGLYSFLEEDKSYRVLILDNLSSLAPGIDENTKQDWDAVNQWLLRLRWLGMAVILVHHAGKGGGQRGTSGREDNLDISIRLSRPNGYSMEDGCKFEVEFTKARNLFGSNATPFSFQITEVDSRLTWTTGGAGGMKELIIAELGRGTPQKDIPTIVGCDKSHVSKVRKKAIKDGYLTDEGKFTDEGRRLYGDVGVR